MIRDFISGRGSALVTSAEHGPTFEINPEALPADIPPEFYGLTTYVSTPAPVGPVTRKQAISIPAVKRVRDLVPGTLGTLPIDVIGPTSDTADWSLLDQPERDVPRSVTMARTFDDAFFYERAWWRVTEFAWNGYPRWIKRIDPRRVTVNEDLGVAYIDGKPVPSNELIRFDSPTEGLLYAGARAIRTCLNLDDAAARAADGTPPVDYFTSTDGHDPEDDDEVKTFLDAWADARRSRRTGYVPAGLEYKINGFSPKDLQLADARQHAVLEIARLAGVDPEELGVSTTSRTYANQYDRRKAFLDFTLGQYRQAFEDRLSMNDVTPRGYSVKFNLSSFLRSDDKTRMETYEIGQRVGAYTKDEIRGLEDRPALTAAEREESAPQAPAVLPAPAEEAA
ncbi:MAG: phage portal protein [Aeromicrobium sp.]|uniref:phage portal protein n=1 Tax=Aeromicrobium sp. TaxID=1871063 RepID=UPI002618822D|nr:phage portal protein [Aeromicrobium sp.]MDF1705060.1 phage portal protein [Aeromicrobium sp.]